MELMGSLTETTDGVRVKCLARKILVVCVMDKVDS